MRKIIAFVALTVLLGSRVSQAQVNQFGRYVGTLTHDNLNQQQLAKIDFVVSRDEGNEIELKAVLTLQFGDFKSGEYIAHHFDNVRFNLLAGSLVFDQPDEDVTITTSRFAQGELVGELRSATFGRVGTLKLRLATPAQPSLPLIEPLNGEYAGRCEGRNGRLQLHTMRSIEDSSRVGNPFGTFEVKGQFGNVRDEMCNGLNSSRACERFGIERGSYNFYSGELTLVGDLQNWSCKVDSRGMGCDNGCRFERISAEAQSRVFIPPQAAPAFPSEQGISNPALTGPTTSISGTYKGYVHNEYLDRYQAIQISMVTFQNQENGESNLRLSAVANLYFGAQGSSEVLSYRFAAKDYPNPVTRPQFVLSRLEDDVDAFLKITSIRDGILKGEWHSLLFGRVGTFEARKEALTPLSLPPRAKMVAPVTSFYDETNWDLDLKVFQNRTPPNTENPFFPLDFGGTMRLKGGGAREPIKGGSYDFYTGKIGLEWSQNHWMVGKRPANERLDLITITNVFGSLMPEFSKPRLFNLVPNRNN